MIVAVLLAFQPAAPPAAAAPIDFDLAKHRAAPASCADRSGADIVVCGRRPAGDYPYEQMERLFREKPLVAETGIGGGATARAYVEGVEVVPGVRSNRLMIGVKVPF